MPSKNFDKNNLQLIRHNASLVKQALPDITRARLQALKELTKQFSFSFASGDVIQLESRWYVTHTGLLRLARRKRCRGIHVEAVDSLCDSAASRFVLKATVYPSKDSAGFVGYGDADPSNVSALVRGAEMRIAETRAVNRALRKAYGIGICSVEELGSNPAPMQRLPIYGKFPPKSTNGNGNGSGHKVRDRLCQIIRQHKLDPELVKAYAVDFCGTKALKDATREQVEELRPAARRGGQEGPCCPGLPAQQLRTRQPGGGRMKRQVPGLSETARDSHSEVPDGMFLVRLDSAQHRWHAQKPFYVLRLSVLEPERCRALHRQPPLLHPQGDVEAGLVPAGFPL